MRRITDAIRSRYQRADWAKHTAVLAALIAALGLGVTAWGTVKAAEIANDQLAQSREQQEEDARKVASSVTFWPERGGLVITNRGLDPVEGTVRLNFPLSAENELYMRLPVGAIPPCSRLDIPEVTISRTSERVIRRTSGAIWEPFVVDALIVQAPSGKPWIREEGKEIERAKPADLLLGSHPPHGARELATNSSVKLTALEDCGSTK
ncbi:hypothetical protein ACFC0D_19190 [Streptomyces sp. NPDC056222]|uniref:hypothetical protein n=1 Tax=Streptomyces sp. NPDC056222 TaxID=3345749 RepID=UPI0035DE2057